MFCDKCGKKILDLDAHQLMDSNKIQVSAPELHGRTYTARFYTCEKHFTLCPKCHHQIQRNKIIVYVSGIVIATMMVFAPAYIHVGWIAGSLFFMGCFMAFGMAYPGGPAFHFYAKLLQPLIGDTFLVSEKDAKEEFQAKLLENDKRKKEWEEKIKWTEKEWIMYEIKDILRYEKYIGENRYRTIGVQYSRIYEEDSKLILSDFFPNAYSYFVEQHPEWDIVNAFEEHIDEFIAFEHNDMEFVDRMEQRHLAERNKIYNKFGYDIREKALKDKQTYELIQKISQQQNHINFADTHLQELLCRIHVGRMNPIYRECKGGKLNYVPYFSR